MDGFETVRAAARALRAEILTGDACPPSSEIVELALTKLDLELAELPPGNPMLAGALGLLNRQFRMVLCRNNLSAEEKAEVIAHEIGHWLIHTGPETAVRPGYGTPTTGDPVQRVEAYGIKERREAQANVFARELLLPRGTARRLFFEGLRARAIARKLELQLATVFQQLADALLLPEPPAAFAVVSSSPPPSMDEFQSSAAAHRGEPFLLEAGPGTGKTKTLVGRIIGLLGEGAQPSSILALTFSNKAATELLDRIASAAGPPAAEIWTGTFHSFGLDLIRKHSAVFGKSPDPRLIDTTEAINLLEDRLPALPIVHHQNLFDPALALREILRAISRAKDELIGPERYEALARAMEASASSAEERVEAAKALEVALVYRHYQEELNASDALDYGDLIMLPALTLQTDSDFAAALRERYEYVHVDEYQDINRASAVLVKGIVGDGENLWVVGDARQSIYRFRGASATNMAKFEEDYPTGKRQRLGVNYRSSTANVAQVVQFGQKMRVSSYSLPLQLRSDRGAIGSAPACIEAADPDEEMSVLAGEIESLAASGTRYSEQVVLARSNSSLARSADELTARGLPVLYLGPIFERPEVRDLVSLLSLLVDNNGTGLARVAAFPEYSVTLADLDLLFRQPRDQEESIIAVIRRLETGAGITNQSLVGLAKIAAHLDRFSAGSTPWLVLMEYLFERSDYLQALLTGQAPSDAMRRIAVRQLIDAVRSMPLTGSKSPIARALQRIRHMVMLADDRELRQLPAEAAHLDGVRMMTLHGSKGLEFEAVHLPGMHAGGMPARNQPDRCPPPTGMLTGFEESDAHEAEEECLFFVGISRAKSHLRAYRSLSRGGRNSSPSSLLAMTTLPRVQAQRRTLKERLTPRAIPSPILIPRPPEQLTTAEIEQYDRCPRQFFYERVLGLRGYRGGTAYLAAHRCLLAVLDYVRSLEPGGDYEAEKAAAVYEAAWTAYGPNDHPFRNAYRKLTDDMLSAFNHSLAGAKGSAQRWVVQLGGVPVEVRSDQVLDVNGRRIVRTFRSNRPRSGEADRLANTLLLKAIEEQLGAGTQAETLHLVGGTTTPVTQTVRKFNTRLESCQSHVSSIARGEFPPAPSEFSCPRCPFYFVCPALAAVEE